LYERRKMRKILSPGRAGNAEDALWSLRKPFAKGGAPASCACPGKDWRSNNMTSPWISPFIDASALLRPNPAEFSYGCLIADLDRDGLPELLVVTVHAPTASINGRATPD
jgi:hypothetical protein